MIPSTTKFLPSYRSIWLLSFPLIIAGISETIVALTDTIFLANYGTNELAALGLSNSLYIVALFLILGFVDGIQISIGRRAGEERYKEIGKVLNQGLYLLGLISIVMILFVLYIVPLLTTELFQSKEIHASVTLYLNIAIFGIIFHSFNLALSVFYIAISRTSVFIGATLVLAITNISLDYLLIFGNYGFSEMGIEGAAVASLVAEISFSIFLLIDILRRRYIKIYGLFLFEKVDRAIIRTLSKLSMPVSLGVLIESLRWFLFFVIIEHLGEKSLATATIVFSLYSLLLIPIYAFSETTCSMVSNLIGQKDEKDLFKLIFKTILLAYLSVVPILVATIIFPEYLLALFATEESMLQSALSILMIIVIATIVAVPAEIFTSSVAGTGDTTVPFAIEIIVSLAILSYAYYAAFVALLSLEYIWLTEIIGWTIYLILSWIWLRSGFWKRLRI